MRKTTKLRALIDRPEILALPFVFNALTAKMLEWSGAEAVAMSGAFTSMNQLGLPDAGLISGTEMIANAGNMAEAVGIPLVSDADTGFGNAINVRRTVRSFIRAGVAGIHIEDQVFPKRCGFVAGKQIVSLEEAVGKYRAAVDAKMDLDPDFVIIARTDARGAVGGGLEEAIRRGVAYKEAGADVIYVEAPQSLEEVEVIAKEIPGPLMCTLQAIDPPVSTSTQEQMGLAVASLAGSLFAPLIGMWEYADGFRQKGSEFDAEYCRQKKGHALAPIAGLQWLFDLVGFPEIRAMEDKYFPTEEIARRYQESIGMYQP